MCTNIFYKYRLKEFSAPFNLRVFCGTWNVCNKVCGDDNLLKDWLFPKGQSQYADIYAIALQEIVDLNARNVVIDGSKSDEKSGYWNLQLYNIIVETTGKPYTMLIERHLVGVSLAIFVKEVHASQVSDYRGATLGIGLMGVMGNKGAVSIRMNIFDTSVCFVSCHLRAHKEEVLGRNIDAKQILERTNFLPVIDSIYQANIPLKASNSWRTDEFYSAFGIEQHDYVFILGDLNYRIANMPTLGVFGLLETDAWRNLLSNDQLNIERARGAVFSDFQVESYTCFLIF